MKYLFGFCVATIIYSLGYMLWSHFQSSGAGILCIFGIYFGLIGGFISWLTDH